jgi:hypothetical protein
MKTLRLTIAACLMLFLAVTWARGQVVPQYVTTLFILNGATGETLNGCETRVSCKLSTTGETVNENVNGTSSDDFRTNPYPVGSELEIIVTKAGFQRHALRHIVCLDEMANRIDVRMFPVAIDTVGLVIEGDLSFVQDGIRQVVQGESVRIYTLNGVINVEVDQNGFFKSVLTDKNLAGKDSLKVRAAYAGNRFEPQDIYVSTKAHYKMASFQLIPKTELVTLEVEVKDSLTGKPIENAHVRIYQGGRLITEGNTSAHGYHKTESRFSRLNDSLEIQVFKEGYGTFSKVAPLSNNNIRFALCSTHIKLYGTIADTKKTFFQVQIKIDSSILGTVQASESGDWEFIIARDKITNGKTITVQVDDQNTSGEQQKLLAEIQHENVVEFPAIDPKSRAGKWRSQINFGFGLGLDPQYPPMVEFPKFSIKEPWKFLHRSADVAIGFRRVPNFLVGIGYNTMRLLFQDTISILGNNKDTTMMPPQEIQLDYFSLNVKYAIGPKFLPGVKLLLGAAVSIRHQRLLTGVQLGLGKRTKLELTSQYLISLNKVTMYTFNPFGPPIASLMIPHTIRRPMYFLTLIKRISW